MLNKLTVKNKKIMKRNQREGNKYLKELLYTFLEEEKTWLEKILQKLKLKYIECYDVKKSTSIFY